MSAPPDLARQNEIWRDFRAFAQTQFKIGIYDKTTSPLMNAIGTAIGLSGVQTADEFKRGFSTTILSKVYIPDEWSVISKIMVLPHEIDHTQEKLGKLLAYARGDGRAENESKPLGSTARMMKWKDGWYPTATQLASVLSMYGCAARDLMFAEKILDSILVTVKFGGTVSPTTHRCIQWLDEHAPDVKLLPPFA